MCGDPGGRRLGAAARVRQQHQQQTGLLYWPYCGQIKDTKWTFFALGCHSLLWKAATSYLKSQRSYSQPEAAIVCYGQRPQNLKSQCYCIIKMHVYLVCYKLLSGHKGLSLLWPEATAFEKSHIEVILR